MKKLFTILLASLMVAGFAACSTKDNGTTSSEETSSVASVVSEVSENEDTETSDTPSTEDSESDEEFAVPDTSEMSNPFVFEELAIDLPEGFSEGEGLAGVATVTPDDYPEHSDNFTFVSSPFNGDTSAYSQEALESLYSENFSSFDGLDKFENVTVDGREAIMTKYTVSYMDVDMVQQQLVIFDDDKVFVISYTSTSDDYVDALDNSYETIKIAE